jgi:hypothetical protein
MGIPWYLSAVALPFAPGPFRPTLTRLRLWWCADGLAKALSHNTTAKVVQVIANPYSIVCMPPRTIHRGISNRSSYDRVMFFVTCDTKKITVDEGLFTDGSDSTTNFDEVAKTSGAAAPAASTPAVATAATATAAAAPAASPAPK